MKNQNTKRLKRITALVLCVVLLLTSIPIAFAANGEYNPAPYFSDDAQQKGAAAWLDEEGDLQVRFPAATGRPTHADWKKNNANVKAIDSYVIELSDLGGKLEKHDATPDVLLTKTVPATAVGTGKLSATFTAAEIEALGDKFDIVNKRYNIAITAVDKEGWHSLQLHAMVFDVPEFYFDMSKFEILAEDGYAMRELMRFESAGSYTGYQQTGDSVDKLERAGQTGTEDVTTGVDSAAYRIRITGQPGENGQTVDTGESRQTWNFVGAEEVWYWLDLSNVELKGLSFRLRANEKKLRWVSRTWNSTKTKAEEWTENGPANYYGDTVYSTLGTVNNTYAAGEEPYILVQNENGNWEKVMLNNGTVDLGHFKGYVRIPIQFICAETDSVVNSNSKEFGSGQGNNQGTLNTYFDTKIKLDSPVVVNTAGTPVADSLLIQEGQLWAGRINGDLKYNMGKMLAAGIELGSDGATTGAVAVNPNNPRRAYIEKDADGNWIVQNRENGYKALEDIYSAGVPYQSVSEDSINRSFFIDNIMFYRTDGNMWEHADLDGNASDGTTVATYFDQYSDAQDRILDAIDEYIGSPTWTDYRGVKYVDDMIKTFYETYKQYKGVQEAEQYFTATGLSARAAATGRAKTWTNYTTAKKLCGDAGLMDGNNSRPNDLVPMLVQTLEQLPDPSQVTSISDTLYDVIVKLYQAYIRLNFGQLKMLGSYVDTDADGNVKALYEEEKILRYASILLDQLENNSVTGYRMANYPFIKFNDFENTDLGNTAWQLEDDPTYSSDNDFRKKKGLVTFATNDKTDTDAIGKNLTATYDGSFHIDAGKTEVTQNGYKGSQGLTTTFDSNWLNGGNADKGSFYNIIIAKDSKDSANFSEHKANNMSSVSLGDLAKDNDGALSDKSNTKMPFSLVMYVDFTEFSDSDPDFTFMPNIHTVWKGNDVKARPMFGNMFGDVGIQSWMKTYYVLDQTTGEWQRVYNNTRYMFTSKSASHSDFPVTVDLRGYKGYLAIPLGHFKLDTTTNSTKLDTQAEALNNIYAVQFSISGGNTDGKSFTIDNIGFTYDPAFYGTQARVSDPSYAAVFGAKSTKATEFEQAVAAIDPYDTATLATKIEAAKNIYGYPYLSETTLGTLSQWQKDNVQTVKQAKALLDKYIAGDIPPAAMTVAQLKTAIANLPNIPENAVANNPIPAPGFLSDNSKPLEAGAVNYAAFGFESKEQAEEIVKYYTDTYKRLSAGDQALLTDAERTALLNAYNAAMRCTGTLETIRDNAIAFSDHLKTIYTRYTEGTQTLNLISVSKRNEVAELSATKYEPLPYYAKLGLSDGSLIPAFANMTDGISRYFANVITDDAGNITDGGVKVLMDKYTALYAEVKTQLDAKKVLTDDLVSRLNETIAEYNDLIPAYKNIFELYYGSVQADASGTYQGIKDIIELFDRYDVAFENPVEGTEGKTATLALNPDNESTASQTLNVNYLEELPVETGGASNTYFKIKYNGTLTGGVDTRSYVLMLNGNDVTAVDLAADPIMITEAMLGDTLKNNTYSAENPFKMVFTARLTSTEEFAQQLSDVVTIYQYRPADPEKGETGEQLLGTYKLNVTYTPEESYVVTIPAEFPIDWGNTNEVDVSYEVDCVLGTGKKIEVDVTGSGKLTAEANSAYTMNYTAEGFGSKSVFTGVHTGSKPANAPTVQISQNMWDNSPVGKYKDTLTYTVEYTTP